MVEKKYRWLQLDENFFREKTMRKIRRIAGGDTYIIIYLKMQLLSLQYAGKIYYEGIEDDLAAEIALIIDEDLENVKVTLSFLFKYGLVIESDVNTGEYILPETMAAIGSVTAGAIRMRRHRAKEKVSQCDGGVTALLQSGDEKNNTTENNNNREQQQQESVTSVVNNYCRLGVDRKVVMDLIAQYGVDVVKSKADIIANTQVKKSVSGLLIKACVNNYVVAAINNRQTTANPNYQQNITEDIGRTKIMPLAPESQALANDMANMAMEAREDNKIESLFKAMHYRTKEGK